MNAYISAIDIRTNTAVWHSPPLVSNAGNFEVLDDYLITGYGFSLEDDFLFLLRRDTGGVAARIPLQTSPVVILKKGNRLYVRTYAENVVFEVATVQSMGR